MNRRRGRETNEAALKGALSALDGKLDAYNDILGKQRYLAGDVSYHGRLYTIQCIIADHRL